MADPIFDIDDGLRITGRFSDLDDVPGDPDTVTLILRRPDGTATTIEEADLVRDGVGIYHYDFVLDQSGRWRWRWEGSGTIQAAEQGRFWVDPDRVSV